MPVPATKPYVPEVSDDETESESEYEYEESEDGESEDGESEDWDALSVDISTYDTMTLDELTEEKARVETVFAKVRKLNTITAFGAWENCVTRINKLKALIVAGVLNK